LKTKEVIFISNFLGNGGAARVITLLADKLSTSGYQVTIISFPYEGIEYPKYEKITYIKLVPKGQGINKIISRINLLRNELKKFNNAAVISFEYFVNMQTVIASIGLHNRVIVSERNAPDQVGGKFPTNIIRNMLYLICDTLVCQTPDAKAYFPKGVQKHTVIIPNPIKDDLPEPWKGERIHEIVNFCRLEKQKNLPLLIEAFIMFRSSHQDYTLAIYGDGNEKESIAQYICDKDIQNCISLHSAVTDIHERILKSAMFISSSNYEGLSNSMLEAMALGLPCIVTDCPCGGARMVIKNRENGVLVPVGDRDALVNAMNWVIDNPDECRKLSAAALNIRKELDIEEIVAKWKVLF
jgi:glycosyltransferase involved in cell wall biosynthesis